MKRLKLSVITSERQYDDYAKLLWDLLHERGRSKRRENETEHLTFLIEQWDNAHNTFPEVDPITLLRSLMDDHKMKSKDLANLLGRSKGLISDMLNYKKPLSKKTVEMLAERFKLSKSAFDRPYPLKSTLDNPAT